MIMICKYCNAQIDNNERICPNCGKLLQNKKSGLIIALAIAVACIIAVLFVFGYMGIRGKLWFQRDSFDNQQDANQDDIAVNDVASENDSKIL